MRVIYEITGGPDGDGKVNRYVNALSFDARDKLGVRYTNCGVIMTHNGPSVMFLHNLRVLGFKVEFIHLGMDLTSALLVSRDEDVFVTCNGSMIRYFGKHRYDLSTEELLNTEWMREADYRRCFTIPQE